MSKIFISATSQGFAEHRRLATTVVNAQGYEAVVQEYLPTPTRELTSALQLKVYESQAFVGIVGPIYGYPSRKLAADGQPLSCTQYELDYARGMRKPCLIFTYESDEPIAVDAPEPDALRRRQAAFVASLRRDRTLSCVPFSSLFDFVLQLAKVRWQEWLDGR